MKYSRYYILPLLMLLLAGTSCKKELDVKNPNDPTLTDAQTESGIISLAKGAVYRNGFNGVDFAGDGLNWLGDSYFSLVYGYQELLADVISATASNQNINVINVPKSVTYSDGESEGSTASQRSLLRISNQRSARSANAFYYEWAFMYNLNNSANQVLSVIPTVTFTGDAEAKMNTLKAWAYWWKGYAYSRIGSIYYAGLINDDVFETNSNYVGREAIITEANKNLDLAATTLQSITNTGDYEALLSQLVPDFTQTGHGGVLNTTAWMQSINTLKARNILVNKKESEMTNADWNAILTLTADGITADDAVFTGRTTESNGFFSTTGGSVAAMTTGEGSTFSISERLIQEYKTGDKRLANNFTMRDDPQLNQTGGFTFSTRWYLADGGNGITGVDVLTNQAAGEYELYIAGSYEENALMRAEALIHTGKTDEGLALIDAVRDYQGAGIAHVAGTGLSVQAAISELRRERRVALLFRGVSFYDYRRWGYIYDAAAGGGRTGAVVLKSDGTLDNNATINYDFLDYWDVPADETELNPPSADSAPVKNPG